MQNSLKPLYLLNATVAGLLFGAGLYIAQMVDPLKVLGFLDIGAIATGGWDPSLGFVIVPAIVIFFLADRFVNGWKRPIFNGEFHRPNFSQIDTPLIAGAVLFGVGWGISGICPGPAITLIAFMPENLLIFLIPMFAGSFLGSYVMKLMIPRTAVA